VAALVEATARVLTTEGFARASTNRIAEVAGVSVGSLYQYFPSKEALVLAVAEQHHGEIMRLVRGELEEVLALPVEAGVRRLVEVSIEGHRVNPRLHLVLAEQIPRTGVLEGVEAINDEAHRLFRTYLESHRDELTVTDVGLAAFVCATSIEAMTHNAVLHRPELLASDKAVEQLVDEATRLILGYLKPAERSQRNPASCP
jgi:AcrR family transcriptional regulator